MKLQTKIPFSQAAHPIDYQSRLLLLGSCFVENIGNKLAHYKFRSLQNPFGVLFHPVAIENLIERAVAENVFKDPEVFHLGERWHSFAVHSDLSDREKKHLLQKLNEALVKTKEQLRNATHIIITAGTAWTYRHLESNTVVANCHKVAQSEFSKELLSVKIISESLERSLKAIRSVNEKAFVIFTVSPVRHLKDGFVENQLSKAHLHAALHSVLQTGSPHRGEGYFPAYELMMDELRDYRFYEADMIHPNSLAIDYIWEKFKEVWIAGKAAPVMDAVEVVQKGLRHRPFNWNSEQHQKFVKSLQEKITYLQNAYPFMEFETTPLRPPQGDK